MGQYYLPCILKPNKKTIIGFVNPNHLGNGLKLMEHSYLNNSVCNTVLNYLKENGGGCVVWAGDYAQAEPRKISKDEAKELWKTLIASGEIECSFAKFWASDKRVIKLNEYGEYDGENLYRLTGKLKKPELTGSCESPNIRFIVNEDNKEYVDLWEVPNIGGDEVNPLPLLTAEGNGQGGGDYDGNNMKYVGTWARNFITVHEHDWGYIETLQKGGYKKITPNFVERYTIVRGLDEIAKILKEYFAEGADEWALKEVKDSIKKLRETVKPYSSNSTKKEEKTPESGEETQEETPASA